MQYLPGMQQIATQSHYVVRLLSSDPGPPIKGNNIWMLQLLDPNNQPTDGATFTVTPFMPDHGHGTPIRVSVTPSGSPGTYQLSPVNLFMSGLWRVTVTFSANSAQDSVAFLFCIEG